MCPKYVYLFFHSDEWEKRQTILSVFLNPQFLHSKPNFKIFDMLKPVRRELELNEKRYYLYKNVHTSFYEVH